MSLRRSVTILCEKKFSKTELTSEFFFQTKTFREHISPQLLNLQLISNIRFSMLSCYMLEFVAWP